MKILITAPSLNENVNVSGISTLVRQIVGRGKAEFYHFQAGRADGDKSGGEWFFQQIFLIPRFLKTLRRRKIALVHLNTALVPLSIIRDAALTAAARWLKLPVLLHLHGGRFLMEDFDNRILARICEKMLRSAAKILVLSEHEKASLERRWTNLPIEILPNAVAVDEIPLTAKEISAEKTIIYLGRLHESKGLHEIIEACRALKNENFNFRFRCFGAGAEQEFFTTEMTRILSDDFYYGGVISGAEKWRNLAESDIFLLPSRYGEGLPMAMLEAMAAGCIVIAADVASVRAVIKDGDNGFLVEPYKAAQVAEKLRITLSERIDGKALRRRARHSVEENFAFSDYLEKLEKIYAEVGAAR